MTARRGLRVRPVRVATRASDLALAQARGIAARIEAELGAETTLVPLTTTGDRRLDARLADLGGKGLFVKEIEDALQGGHADLAVHSAKDLPAELPDGLGLVAFPERADPRDALVARRRGITLDELPAGARVGTGSLRRTAQLMASRPDLAVVPIRGNVPTRIAKLESDDLDAVVLACAGLDRLGLADRIDERIAPERMLPAPTQGILALEARTGEPLWDDLAKLADAVVTRVARAERAFLARLEGDCSVPAAALVEVGPDGSLSARGLVASPDGARVARGEARGQDEVEVGESLAERVLADGGDEILRALRETGP